MQLKHKQQPCFAALVHLRRRPTENKRPAYRRFATKPAKLAARKCNSAPTLHFGRENRHSPLRFDKILYFFSLFIVPNGCHGAALPPSGAPESRLVPPPSPRIPRQVLNVSSMHWTRGGNGGEEGTSRAQALKIWLQWLHMAELSLCSALLAGRLAAHRRQSIKMRWILNKFHFLLENEKCFVQMHTLSGYECKSLQNGFFHFINAIFSLTPRCLRFFWIFFTCDAFVFSGNRNRSSRKGGGKTCVFLKK